jgi:hypothetical protein
MSSFTVSVTHPIPAAAATVYALLADYKVGHPSILPKPYFQRLVVNKGGIGAGTIFTAEMKVMGSKQSLTMEVTEPAPGKHLRETNHQDGMVTDFLLEPQGDGKHCLLTIKTTGKFSKGIKGLIERLFSPGFMRKLYKMELDLIAQKFETA